jgi:ribosomal-protein-alanine N-acetyltransferase
MKAMRSATNPDVHLRPARPADTDELMALAAASSTAAHWTRQQYEDVLLSPASQYLVLVIEESAAIRAFIVARALTAEWEIENVVVAADRVRRGLATRLVAAITSRARAQQAEAIHLEVRDSNRPARALYERLSFHETSRRKNYYRDPIEDAVLYRCTLT